MNSEDAAKRLVAVYLLPNLIMPRAPPSERDADPLSIRFPFQS